MVILLVAELSRATFVEGSCFSTCNHIINPLSPLKFRVQHWYWSVLVQQVCLWERRSRFGVSQLHGHQGTVHQKVGYVPVQHLVMPHGHFLLSTKHVGTLQVLTSVPQKRATQRQHRIIRFYLMASKITFSCNDSQNVGNKKTDHYRLVNVSHAFL